MQYIYLSQEYIDELFSICQESDIDIHDFMATAIIEKIERVKSGKDDIEYFKKILKNIFIPTVKAHQKKIHELYEKIEEDNNPHKRRIVELENIIKKKSEEHKELKKEIENLKQDNHNIQERVLKLQDKLMFGKSYNEYQFTTEGKIEIINDTERVLYSQGVIKGCKI